MDAAALVADWAGRGSVEQIGDESVFVIDTQAVRSGSAPPLLVLHGYPTSSIDFAAVLGTLATDRRVILFDSPGFGLSSKPDRPYSIFGMADTVEALVASLGLDEVDLLTHDLGDSVGGELLARGIDGTLGFGVRRRVITNGSIYMHLVQLSNGQKLLESLPDEAIAPDLAPDVDAVERSLIDTLAPSGSQASRPDRMHVRAGAVLVVHEGGNRLLARQIRYLGERRANEARWTGAIERHPAPLAIVWGDVDPIAVWPMTDELLAKRPDATRTRLTDVGHYPMVEAPAAFSKAVLAGLTSS
ncbi:MAG: alpha/beta hydrolase [Acidimicrobiia bacterium]